MAKMYFRFGEECKTTDLCLEAFKYTSNGMNVIGINADANKDIVSKLMLDGNNLLRCEVNFKLDGGSIYEKLYNMDLSNTKYIFVDNAQLLTRKQADELFYATHLLDINVNAYGDRLNNGMFSEGSMRLMELSDYVGRVVGYESLTNSKLSFNYGTMSCSKTSKLLAMCEYLRTRGLNVKLMKPELDRDRDFIVSKPGKREKADYVLKRNDHIYGEGSYMMREHVNCIMVDEAQFLTVNQIDELYRITRDFMIPVMCYGLRTDFMTNSFPGSCELLQIADDMIKFPSVCKCGDGAEFNARMDKNGIFVKEGNQVEIDNGESYIYRPLCPDCYIKNVMDLDKEKVLKLGRR